MAKFIVQLRRGTKEEWELYEQEEPEESKPRAGELVVEYDDGVPRLKIGDGVTPYGQLPYMSVDSFVLPKQISVTLYGSEDEINIDKPQWEEETDEEGNFLGRYKQLVTIDNAVITPNSKIDLQPTSDDLVIFHEKGLAFVAENEDGVVTVYCVGQKPKSTYTIPVTVTEVVCNG